ncbi:MAG: hypothetical protein HY051_02875 [Candidatus Aenigmarchaeota archaeon]|nr:hypothetical protein [Candidatus Aenigmarchaeota archaeon]
MKRELKQMYLTTINKALRHVVNESRRLSSRPTRDLYYMRREPVTEEGIKYLRQLGVIGEPVVKMRMRDYYPNDARGYRRPVYPVNFERAEYLLGRLEAIDRQGRETGERRFRINVQEIS